LYHNNSEAVLLLTTFQTKPITNKAHIS
jgi:hypothetical protein